MFVKLFSQILDSSIADDRRLRHFFTDVLLCADGEGFVMMTPQALSRRIGASMEEVEWGIAELMKPDPRSKTPDNEGRRIEAVEGCGYGWRILNYDHYRAMKDGAQLREAVKRRVQRFRDRQAQASENQQHTEPVTPCNAHVTPCNASNAMQKEKETEKADGEAKPPNPQRGKRNAAPKVSDDEWLTSLETDPTYIGIDIKNEFGKMNRWCEAANKQPSRRRFINWINRADRPIKTNGNHADNFV